MNLSNMSCLKCDVVSREMIKIGAFVMCEECCAEVFGSDCSHIDTISDLYKTYREWLKKYQKKYGG